MLKRHCLHNFTGRVAGKVMFSQASVYPQGWGGVGVWSQGGGGGCLVGVRPPPPLEMATVAVGTHPTGMHSCLLDKSSAFNTF